MGDKSKHTADFHSFGDKNMLNSTGSNTGSWNTKNTDSSPLPAHMQRRASGQSIYSAEVEKGSEKESYYRYFGARQTRDGYKWDGNMPGRSGTAQHRNTAFCEPTDYVYLAEDCVPSSSKTSTTRKTAKQNSYHLPSDKRDQVNLNLIRGNFKGSNVTRSGNNNAVEVLLLVLGTTRSTLL